MDSKSGNLALIGQIRDVLVGLSELAYTKPLEILHGATLGQHFRHILDFYQCLLRDVPAGTVDYARRARNPLMETVPAAAGAAFGQVASDLCSLQEGQHVWVLGDFSAQDLSADKPLLQSSVGRELMYAHDHAVHHLALIRIGLKEIAPDVPVDSNMGYAPATVQHRASHS